MLIGKKEVSLFLNFDFSYTENGKNNEQYIL